MTVTRRRPQSVVTQVRLEDGEGLVGDLVLVLVRLGVSIGRNISSLVRRFMNDMSLTTKPISSRFCFTFPVGVLVCV